MRADTATRARSVTTDFSLLFSLLARCAPPTALPGRNGGGFPSGENLRKNKPAGFHRPHNALIYMDKWKAPERRYLSGA